METPDAELTRLREYLLPFRVARPGGILMHGDEAATEAETLIVKRVIARVEELLANMLRNSN